jgi:hypothetical protein
MGTKFRGIILLLAIFSSSLFAKQYVAILELGGTISKTESGILTDKLISLLASTGDYRVVERSQMQSILQEQEFQQSGCTSGECAVEVGQILGVEKIISGSIGKLGSLYSISLKKVDVATGEIEETSSYEIKGSIEDVLTKGLSQSVKQFSKGSVVTKSDAAEEPIKIEEPKEVELTPMDKYKSRKKKKVVFTVITATGAAASAGVAVYFLIDMNQKYDDYKELPIGSDFDSYWNSFESSRNYMIISSGVGVGFTTAAIIIGTRKIEMPSGNEVSVTPQGTFDSASLTLNYHF